MRKLTLLVAVGALCLVAGCAFGPSPLAGGIYSDVKYPSYYQGVDATGPGAKTGKSEMMGILNLVAIGDASVETACQNGQIGVIKTIDHRYFTILGVYSTWTTLVTGE